MSDRARLGDTEGDVCIAAAGCGTNVIGIHKGLRVVMRRLAVDASRRRRVRALIGTSGGGLAVLGAAFGVDEERMDSQLEGASSHNRLIAGNPVNLLMRGGWASMDEFRRNAELVLPAGARLGQAQTPVACVVGDTHTGEPRVISSWEHPDVDVIDLACCTAAVPVLFEEQRCRGLDDHDYVDGGIAANLMAEALDRFDVPVISLRPAASMAAAAKPKGPLGRLIALARLLHHPSNNAWASRHPDRVVVDIPGGDGFDFSLDHAECARRRKVATLAAEAAHLPGGTP